MGDPLASFGGAPSAFTAISKWHFYNMSSIELIWNLSGGSWAASGCYREVLIGIDLAQGEDLGEYFRLLKKTEKGQWLLTFRW